MAITPIGSPPWQDLDLLLEPSAQHARLLLAGRKRQAEHRELLAQKLDRLDRLSLAHIERLRRDASSGATARRRACQAPRG